MKVMALRVAAALATLVVTGLASGSGAKVTPVQKVIQMLTSMLENAKDEKHQEMVQFAAYKQFCDGVSLEKQNVIQDADDRIELLDADLTKFNAEVTRLGDAILGHEGDVAGWEQDITAAEAVRAHEQKTYMATHHDYVESIDAITEAIRILKLQNYDRPGVSALLQKVGALNGVPSATSHAIEAFLARDSDEPELGQAPQANAYEFQSGGVVDMLEKLKVKFRDEKTTLEKDEMQEAHDYTMLVQDLTSSIKAAKDGTSEKTVTVSKHKQTIADTTGQLKDVTTSRADDAEYLQDLTTTCTEKSADYDSRQKLRKDEIMAIEKAITILSGDKVAGVAATSLPTMIQKRRGTALVQLRRADPTEDSKLRMAAYLRDRSMQLGSRVLSTIAMKARDGPFDKVKQLIEELINRLMAEAGEEADHKGWCDTELSTNEQTRNTKTTEAEQLRNTIDTLTSRIEVLKKDIAKLSQEVADITSAVAEATDMRSTEKTKNEKTILEAQDAQTKVSEAITVLKDFYDRAADATALMQASRVQVKGHRQEPPPTFDEPYKGQQAESGGVLGMLEVVHSDFARLEQETQSSEEAAQGEYDTFMSDSATDEGVKNIDIGHFKSEKLTKEGDLLQANTDLGEAESMLNSANRYYDELKPACINTGMDHEERARRRKDEIEALQEALRILSGEDLAALAQE